MTTSSKTTFALVKWVEGEDEGMYTTGMNINHIKDFNIDDLKNDKIPPTKPFAVEWRETKKEPLGGWPCFMAQVIHVSASLKVLDKKLECIEGKKSPGRVVKHHDSDDNKENSTESTTDSHTKIDQDHVAGFIESNGSKLEKLPNLTEKPTTENKNDNVISAKKSNDKDNIEEIEEIDAKKKLDFYNHKYDDKEDLSPKRKIYSFDDEKDPLKQLPSTSTAEKKFKSRHDPTRNEEIDNFSNESFLDSESNSTDYEKDPVKQLPSTSTAEKKFESEDGPTRKRKIHDFSNDSSPKEKTNSSDDETIKFEQRVKGNNQNLKLQKIDDHSKSNMKELGNKGSKIFITNDQWKVVKSKGTFSSMTGALLELIFPVETLMKSNYKGGVSKNNKGEEKKEGLDPFKLAAILRKLKIGLHKLYDSTIYQMYNCLLSFLKTVSKYRGLPPTKGSFGTAVNQKCASVRAANGSNQGKSKKKKTSANEDTM